MADPQNQTTLQATLPTREGSVCATCSSSAEATTSTEALVRSLQAEVAFLKTKVESNNMPSLKVFYLFPQLPGELRIFFGSWHYGFRDLSS